MGNIFFGFVNLKRRYSHTYLRCGIVKSRQSTLSYFSHRSPTYEDMIVAQQDIDPLSGCEGSQNERIKDSMMMGE